MINLPIPRNENGLYVLNDKTTADFEVYENIDVFTGEEFLYNFWLVKDSNVILVKYLSIEDQWAIWFRMYAELIFSKFAQSNGVSSADIDVGMCGGHPAVLSKDVRSKNGEAFSGYTLFKLVGFDREEISVDKVYEALLIYVEKLNKKGANVTIDEKIYLQMLKMVGMDYCSMQEDRHEGNFMFEIIPTEQGKLLRLCPLYDNEFVFCFADFGVLFQYGTQEQKSIISKILRGEDVGKEEIQVLKDAVAQKSNEYLPKLGIHQTLYYRKADISSEEKARFKAGSIMEVAGKLVASDIASEMINNSEFKSFIENMTFNSEEYIKQIYEETGFKVPYMFAVLAEEIFQERKNLLLEMCKEVETEPKGE